MDPTRAEAVPSPIRRSDPRPRGAGRCSHACIERARLGYFVRALLGRPIVDETAAAEPSRHALFDSLGHRRDVETRGRRRLGEITTDVGGDGLRQEILQLQ